MGGASTNPRWSEGEHPRHIPIPTDHGNDKNDDDDRKRKRLILNAL
jgi:hypothetical protein